MNLEYQIKSETIFKKKDSSCGTQRQYQLRQPFIQK